MTIPNVTRNLPEAEQRLLAAAVLVVKAYAVPGGTANMEAAIGLAKDVMLEQAWNYYSALALAHPEIKGVSWTEWIDKNGMSPTPKYTQETSPIAEAIIRALEQFAQIYAMHQAAKTDAPGTRPKTVSPDPLDLGAIMRRIQQLDPELAQKILDFFEKHGLHDRKPPEGAAESPPNAATRGIHVGGWLNRLSAIRDFLSEKYPEIWEEFVIKEQKDRRADGYRGADEPHTGVVPKVPEGHICVPGEEFCCKMCDHGREEGKCNLPESERAMLVTTDRVAYCTGFSPNNDL
jgi:hypothetical protein